MQYSKPLMLMACLFVWAAVAAQQYPFVHYTPKDGLVNSRVRKAYQDSKGRMYFMTFGGLSVYDGTRFTNYTVQNGLAADMVNDLIEMGDDSIWIASNTSALNYLRHGKIGTFKTADGFYPTINKFIKNKDGSLYIIADQGLFVFQQNKFVHLPLIDSQGRDAGNFLMNVIEWSHYLLVQSDPALSNLAPVNFFIYNKLSRKVIAEEQKNIILAICIVNNKIYISAAGGIVQLDTVALLKGEIHYLPVMNEHKVNMPVIHYMYFDRLNNFWLYSGNKKIIKIDPAGLRKEFSIDNGLSSNNFSSIFLDQEGTSWITMNGSGVDKLVNDNIELFDKFGGVSVDNIYADEDMDSVYMYNFSEKKVLIVHQGKITEHRYKDKQIFPNAFSVSAGKIYVSDGKNLFLSDKNNQKNFLLYKDTAALALGNIYIDPYQNPVICGLSYLTVLIADTLVYRYPVKYLIDQIGFDKEKRLWAASRNGELFVLKINPDKQGNYLQLLKNNDKGYPAFSARSLAIDHSDNVWIGTRNDGLYCFQFDQQLNIRSFQHYTTKEGLSDNFVIHLTRDKENNIWASTSSGLDRISYESNNIRISNITRSNNIYEQTLKTFVSKDGVAWSNTADGNLIRIGKNNDSSSFTPSLLITGLRIVNKAADSLSNSVLLSYKQNSFSVSVAAPSFYDEHEVKYSYLLQGSGNDQWSELSNISTFNFINLNPGKYILKIKAVFPGGRYHDQRVDYTFLIHPPWWQTWGFRIISGLLIIGLLIIAVRFYYRRKLEKQRINSEKQQAVEKERTRIATDIHDDLGSGLSRIRYMGEMVKLKTAQQQNILPDIEKISVFSDEMVDKMNEIVWALNEKNDSLEATISYTRSYAAEYLSNNNILCSINLPDEIPNCIIKGETRRNIFLSVKECLHNIIKHAGATETIMTILVKDHLIIQIHDNGQGINWEKIRPFSNGIININKRMKDAGGTVDFKNEEGTLVVLKIPLTDAPPHFVERDRG